MKTLIFAALAAVFATFAAVGAELPFTQTQFDAARAAGKPMAVVFHADWCPTCRAQAPVLRQLATSDELGGVTLFVADFDTEKALEKSLGVTKQSTIIVFKGGRESARSTGDTQRDNLAALLHQAI